MAILDYDLSEATGSMGFEALPSGVYDVHIINSEEAFTRAAQDRYLTLTLQVLTGEYKGRLLFDRIMLEGSAKAISFGRNKLKAIALAVNHRNPNRIGDSSTLHGIAMQVKVTQRTWNEEIQNEVKNYIRINPAAARLDTGSGDVRVPPPPPPPKRDLAQMPGSETAPEPVTEECPF